MHITRRRLLAAVAALAVGTACDDAGTPPPSGSPTPTPSPTTPSPTPAPKLTQPGEARRVVNELYAKAGSKPVVKVDLTADQATLSTIIDKQPKTWQWQQGTVTEVPSNVENIPQTTFDPADFKFDDLNRLFGLAGALSGSTSNQELQIVETTPGRVHMVVVTRPETRPIFFRADGSPIHELDFTRTQDMTEGLRDVFGGRTQLSAVGYDPATGLYASAPDPDKPGELVKLVRKANQPTYSSVSKETPAGLFAAADISASVLATNLAGLPKQHGKKDDATVKFVIDLRDKRNLPTIHWDVGGTKVITDLQGADITNQSEG